MEFRLLESLADRTHNNAVSMQGIAEGYFSREECSRIVQLGENYEAQEGKVGSDETSSKNRKSSVRFVRPDDNSNWIFNKLESALTLMNKQYRFELQGFFEGVQIAAYSGGGFYDYHMDLGPGKHSGRKLSISVQLSDPTDYEGGDLEFLNIEQTVPRSIGSLIVFPSYLVHRVTPVTSGTRRSMVSWISGPPFC